MANNEKVLSIVIPCYNEENSILDLVKKVLESPVPNKEIISSAGIEPSYLKEM